VWPFPTRKKLGTFLGERKKGGNATAFFRLRFAFAPAAWQALRLFICHVTTSLRLRTVRTTMYYNSDENSLLDKEE